MAPKRTSTRKPGRPTLLTPKLQEEICRNLAAGCYAVTACELAQISQTTYYQWILRGEAGEEPYAQFAKAIAHAEAKAEARALALIQKSGETDPRNLQWWLERKYPDRWGRREKHDIGLHGVADQPPVKTETEMVINSDEHTAEVLRILIESGAFAAGTDDAADAAPQ